MAAKDWFYTSGGVERGPVSSAELKRLASQGALRPTDQVWSEGMTEWAPASRIKGLFAAEAPRSEPRRAPAPAPAPAPMPADDQTIPMEGDPLSALASTATATATPSSRAAARGQKAAIGEALGILATNPAGGLKDAFVALGPSRAIVFGVICCVLFDASIIFASYRAYTQMAGLNQGYSQGVGDNPFGSPGFPSRPGSRSRGPSASASPLDGMSVETVKIIGKLAVIATVPLIALTAGLAIGRVVSGGKGQIHGDIFAAGVTLLPLVILILAGTFLGVGNAELIVVLSVVATCMVVLLLYHAFRDISQVSARLAIYAVPATLVIAGYLTKVIVVAILT